VNPSLFHSFVRPKTHESARRLRRWHRLWVCSVASVLPEGALRQILWVAKNYGGPRNPSSRSPTSTGWDNGFGHGWDLRRLPGVTSTSSDATRRWSRALGGDRIRHANDPMTGGGPTEPTLRSTRCRPRTWIRRRWQGKSRLPFFKVRVKVSELNPLLIAAGLRSKFAASAHGVLTPLTRRGENPRWLLMSLLDLGDYRSTRILL
jgi:hypothetical protein